jgi:hypothetical protein
MIVAEHCFPGWALPPEAPRDDRFIIVRSIAICVHIVIRQVVKESLTSLTQALDSHSSLPASKSSAFISLIPRIPPCSAPGSTIRRVMLSTIKLLVKHFNTVFVFFLRYLSNITLNLIRHVLLDVTVQSPFLASIMRERA